jgi:hypothetical protein
MHNRRPGGPGDEEGDRDDEQAMGKSPKDPQRL